jgi:hypothetical protein
MPIFRYFVFVGGALLALLFTVGWVLPAPPVAQSIVSASNDAPLIRIRSDRKPLERVVLDTSQPTIVPPAVQTAAVVTAPQQSGRTNASPELTEMSAKARVRETFAQFVAKGEGPSAKPQAQAPAQPKRKVVRTRSVPPPGSRPMFMVAQQPHFGLFNMTW